MIDSILQALGAAWRRCCKTRPSKRVKKSTAQSMAQTKVGTEEGSPVTGDTATMRRRGRSRDRATVVEVSAREAFRAQQQKLAREERKRQEKYNQSKRTKCDKCKTATDTVADTVYRRLLIPAAAMTKSSAAVMLNAEYIVRALLLANAMTGEDADKTMNELFNVVVWVGAAGFVAGAVCRTSHTGWVQERLEQSVPLLALNVKDIPGVGLWELGALGFLALVAAVNSAFDVDLGRVYHPFDSEAMATRGAGGQRSPVNSGFVTGGNFVCDWRVAVRIPARLMHMGMDALLGYFTVHELLDYLWEEAEDEINSVRTYAVVAAAVYLAKAIGEMSFGFYDTTTNMRKSPVYILTTALSMLRQGGLTLLQSIVFLEHTVEKFWPTETKYLDLLKDNKVSVSIWTASGVLATAAMADTLGLSKRYFRAAQAQQVVSGSEKLVSPDAIKAAIAKQAQGTDPLPSPPVSRCLQVVGIFVLPAAKAGERGREDAVVPSRRAVA